MFFILIWHIMSRFPQPHIQNRQSPLPSGLYTNGAPGNAVTAPGYQVPASNSVMQRVNFQQQPYGSNIS